MSESKKVYFFELLNDTESATLAWLANHGYDGGLLDITFVSCAENGLWRIEPLSESQAWEWGNNVYIPDTDYISEDFLACNGSKSLAEKLWKVLDSIV